MKAVALAEVIDVGPAVEGAPKGQLVVPTVRRPCRHARCLACRSGHQDFGYTGDFTERGIKEAHGFLAVGHSHLALEVLRVLGQNGIHILTSVPGRQAFIEADPASLMRDMVLKNQVVLGTVNAGPEAFAAALQHLGEFGRRWPDTVATLIAGRHPPELAPDLLFERPRGIKTVISF